MIKELTERRFKEYWKRRNTKTDKIEKFRIHFGDISIECTISEPFRIFSVHDSRWCHTKDIKIDVYELRVGDKVDICGSQGVITKIEEILK